MTKSQLAFEAIAREKYPDLSLAANGIVINDEFKEFRYTSMPTESIWQAFDLAWQASRKAALEEAMALFDEFESEFGERFAYYKIMELLND
jgi:hypothetical protein